MDPGRTRGNNKVRGRSPAAGHKVNQKKRRINGQGRNPVVSRKRTVGPPEKRPKRLHASWGRGGRHEPPTPPGHSHCARSHSIHTKEEINRGQRPNEWTAKETPGGIKGAQPPYKHQ